MEVSHSSNAISLRRNIRIDVKVNDMKSLIEISQLMPKEVCSEFTSKYGKILDLLQIRVDAWGLSAMAQYWNPNLRCFELPNLDTTPTIEEYAYMLRIPLPKELRVYLYYGQHVSDGKVAELLEVQLKPSDKMDKGSVRCLKRRFLEVHLRQLAKQQNWPAFKRVLALTIYELVLFPFLPDMVDYAAMDVFYKAEEYNVNPVPVILAETFLSLQVIHENQGKLRCCAQLMYVWIVTHMYARHNIGRIDDPLKRLPIKPNNLYEWIQEFHEVDSKSFDWKCPWYRGSTVIFSCGNFPNVPLMGPRGCVSYSPALVIRQLKWTQHEPLEEVLGGISLLYQECEVVKNTTLAVRLAWGDIRVFGTHELGKQVISHTKRYDAWRKARRGDIVIPKMVPHNEVNLRITKQKLN